MESNDSHGDGDWFLCTSTLLRSVLHLSSRNVLVRRGRGHLSRKAQDGPGSKGSLGLRGRQERGARQDGYFAGQAIEIDGGAMFWRETTSGRGSGYRRVPIQRHTGFLRETTSCSIFWSYCKNAHCIAAMVLGGVENTFLSKNVVGMPYFWTSTHIACPRGAELLP